MRSRLPGVPPYAGVERAFTLNVCGIGGRLAEPPADFAEALVRTEEEYDERTALRLRHWQGVPIGSTVWTRDVHCSLFRGTITGPWRYDASPEAFDADLVHVRDCTWERVPTREVSAAVIETFGRGGKNFQRIRSL